MCLTSQFRVNFKRVMIRNAVVLRPFAVVTCFSLCAVYSLCKYLEYKNCAIHVFERSSLHENAHSITQPLTKNGRNFESAHLLKQINKVLAQHLTHSSNKMGDLEEELPIERNYEHKFQSALRMFEETLLSQCVPQCSGYSDATHQGTT